MQHQDRNREFVQLWTAHSHRVFAYILTLLPNEADAEEVLQETGVALWEKFDDYQSGTNFRAWACRFALNLVRNFRRRQSHRPVLFSDHFVTVIDRQTTAHSASLDEQSVALADCLTKLPNADRELLHQHYEQGESVKSLAQKADRSLDAVYKSLRRIHNLLFDCIRRDLRSAEARGDLS